MSVVADHQTHGDARARRLQRHACIHQRQRAAADRGHRRRTVGFQNVGHQAHGVGEIRVGRKEASQRAFGQSAVADFAAARTAQELHFADAERREVVVQQEALELVLLKQQVEPLHVFLGAQREGGQRLRFAAGEERGTVHARQQAQPRR